MIYFTLVHTAYHLHHWLPRPTRLRLSIYFRGDSSSQVTGEPAGLGIKLSCGMLISRPRSAHYCSQPLLCNLVVNIIFAFLTIGLALLLTQVEPGPKALGGLFVVFGVASFAEGVCTMVFTALAFNCEKTTPELYHLSLLLSVGSLVSTSRCQYLWRAPLSSGMSGQTMGYGHFSRSTCQSGSRQAREHPDSFYMELQRTKNYVFFSITGLIWLANVVSPGLGLNKEPATGIWVRPLSRFR
ncbi:uncharacterized protein LOC110199399 [Phascolarctos cinereus]